MVPNRIISERTINRLPKYLHYLQELEAKGQDRVSSAAIAKELGTTASQVRQDLSLFGSYGAQGYGYTVSRLREGIQGILGLQRGHRVAVIGIGSLGHALIEHLDFSKYGFEVVAGFDIAPELKGTAVNHVPIYSMEDMASVIREKAVDICVLTVPKTAAQKVAKELQRLKVPAIWNFTNVNLTLTDETVVQNIDFLDSLFVLSYYLQEKRKQQGG